MVVTVIGVDSGLVVLNSKLLNVFFFLDFSFNSELKKNAKQRCFGSNNRIVTEP